MKPFCGILKVLSIIKLQRKIFQCYYWCRLLCEAAVASVSFLLPEFVTWRLLSSLATPDMCQHWRFCRLIFIGERTNMTSSRGATHWSGEIWHMMMPVLRQGWVVKQNMTWWWYFVAMLYRNIITLSNHLQEGILTVTYCTFWIDKTNIISIFVFHSHFF